MKVIMAQFLPVDVMYTYSSLVRSSSSAVLTYRTMIHEYSPVSDADIFVTVSTLLNSSPVSGVGFNSAVVCSVNLANAFLG